MLLVGLENLLVLVPFILISQAALISQPIVWSLCLTGAVMAVLRLSALKHWYHDLNLPGRAMAVGAVMLLFNVAVPLIYRHLHETKVGTKPTDGMAYNMNQYAWFALLPAIILLANALPRARATGDWLPQRRWLPGGLFTLWAAGSAVHLYSLGYVYNFDWEPRFLAAPIWALAWTLFFRRDDLRLDMPRQLRLCLLALPAVATLIPVVEGARVLFECLAALNIAGYAFIGFKDTSRAAWHWLGITATMLIAAILPQMVRTMTGGWTDLELGGTVLLTYAGYWIIRSRNPKLGILGAIGVGIAVGNWVEDRSDGFTLVGQAGLGFLILHSLLWRDADHTGARGARGIICFLWVLHSLICVLGRDTQDAREAQAMAGLIAVAAGLCLIRESGWPPGSVAGAAAFVLLLKPGVIAGEVTIEKFQALPAGLWVIAGSLLLFALGTLAALTKPHWNRHSAPIRARPEDEDRPVQTIE